MADIFDMADTWNDAGTTFTAIKMDVTDTASASDSLLLDLQVGGATKFKVDKNGFAYTTQIMKTGTGTSYWSGFVVGDDPAIRASNVNVASFSRFGNNAVINLSGDVTLAVDAANTFALRRSTNAQTLNVYNTYTDASNHERGFMKWNANVLEIGTEAAGTGTARPMSLTSSEISIGNIPISDPVVAGRLWNDNGTLKISAG